MKQVEGLLRKEIQYEDLNFYKKRGYKINPDKYNEFPNCFLMIKNFEDFFIFLVINRINHNVYFSTFLLEKIMPVETEQFKHLDYQFDRYENHFKKIVGIIKEQNK